MLAEDDLNLGELRPDVVRTRESISFAVGAIYRIG